LATWWETSCPFPGRPERTRGNKKGIPLAAVRKVEPKLGLRGGGESRTEETRGGSGEGTEELTGRRNLTGEGGAYSEKVNHEGRGEEGGGWGGGKLGR